MQTHLKFKMWILRIAKWLFVLAGITCIVAALFSDLDLGRETADKIFFSSLVVLVCCVLFFFGRGSRWIYEIEGKDPNKSPGAIQ